MKTDTLRKPAALTPALSAYEEWRSFYDWMEAQEGLSDPELFTVTKKLRGLKNRVVEAPTRRPVDVLAKLLAMSHDGETMDLGKGSRSVLAEARAAIAGPIHPGE